MRAPRSKRSIAASSLRPPRPTGGLDISARRSRTVGAEQIGQGEVGLFGEIGHGGILASAIPDRVAEVVGRLEQVGELGLFERLLVAAAGQTEQEDEEPHGPIVPKS